MKLPPKRSLIAAAILASSSLVRANLVVHDIGSTAANTLTALGKDFVMGCAIVAAGIVIAVFISKKK